MDKYFFQVSYLDMVILKLLSEQDRYGYEIIEEMSSRSENICNLKAGTLYPILASLTEQGFIAPYEKLTEQKRVRKYYRITPSGMSALQNKQINWKEYCRLINSLIEPET